MYTFKGKVRSKAALLEASAMKFLVLPIVMHRIAKLRFYVDATQPIEQLHDFSMPLSPALAQRKPNPHVEHGGERNRRNIALVISHRGRIAFDQDVGAGTQSIRFVDRPDAHNRFPVWTDQSFPLRHHAA